MDGDKYRVNYQSPWPTGSGLVVIKDLPFGAAYLGDTFDSAQINQPEGTDFSPQHTALEYKYAHTKKYSWLTQIESDKVPVSPYDTMRGVQVHSFLLLYTGR